MREVDGTNPIDPIEEELNVLVYEMAILRAVVNLLSFEPHHNIWYLRIGIRRNYFLRRINMSDKKQNNDRYTDADFDVQSPGAGFDKSQDDNKKPSETNK